jgi:hypothetical protein
MNGAALDYRDQIRLLLWSLWGLALSLVLSVGLWAVLSAAGDSVGGRAARWMTAIVAILTVANVAALAVTVARREIE